MMAAIGKFLGGGITDLVENVALEWIETAKEKAEAGHIDAEAKTLMLKALDPNGKMRRELSRFASRAYGFYLAVTVLMIFMSVWGIGGETCSGGDLPTCQANAAIAAELLTELFLPITGSWGAITGASFGVNYKNSAMQK